MNSAVAEAQENIIFPQRHTGSADFLAADRHDGFRHIDILSVPQQNDMRVVILNDFRFFVLVEQDNRKR